MAANVRKIPVRSLLSLINKRFLQTSPLPSPLPPSSSSSLTVQYLTNSCGLGLESALSISQKFRINEKSPRKSDLILNLLRTYEFDDTHISKLVEKLPCVLRCNAMVHVKPKFEYLVENGFKGKLLPELIVANPSIIVRGLHSTLKPVVKFLKEFLPTDEEFIASVKRSSWLFSFDAERVMQPNADLLIKEGVPVSFISKLLTKNPRILAVSHDRMIESVKAIKDMGIQPNAPKFTRALLIYCSLSHLNWKKKLETFRSLGWSDEETLTAFKNDPFLFGCSEEKLRMMMDFFTTTLKLEQQTIISNPFMFCYSMDKRVHPRYEILKLLRSNNLIEKNRNVVRLLTMSEKKFLDEYVTKHKDNVPGLLDLYKNTRLEGRCQLKKSHEGEKLIV